MNPKVFSILNVAKMSLSPEELKELALCIDKEFGRNEPVKRAKKSKALENWTLENVTEMLLATQFKKRKRA